MRALLLASVVLLSACAPAAAPRSISGAAPAASVSPAEQVVQVQLEAYNRRDLEGFLATYSPDIRIYLHPDRLLMSGLDQMRKEYGDAFTANPNGRAAITGRMVQGNYVIDHEHVTGLADGREIRAVAVYEVRDGKIRNVWFID
jgi:hypothetical protein